jgi:hypothetical protein
MSIMIVVWRYDVFLFFLGAKWPFKGRNWKWTNVLFRKSFTSYKTLSEMMLMMIVVWRWDVFSFSRLQSDDSRGGTENGQANALFR